MKTLLSTACIHDCGYCPNATTGSRRGETGSPEEVVDEFISMRRNGFTGGLFLSSGVVRSAEHTQEMLVEAAELARTRGYTRYLHLKVMPGAPRHLVKRGAESADLLSINVETLPNRMDELSSTKHYRNDIERRLRWIAKEETGSGATTQIIVGGTGETDRHVFDEMRRLYDRYGLRRVYYSAFRPITGTGLGHREPVDPSREVRLYRMDWLRRIYGFTDRELERAFDGETIPEEPKHRLAEQTGLRVDVESANRDELLRIPGVGPETAERLLRTRNPELVPRKGRPFLAEQTKLSGFVTG